MLDQQRSTVGPHSSVDMATTPKCKVIHTVTVFIVFVLLGFGTSYSQNGFNTSPVFFRMFTEKRDTNQSNPIPRLIIPSDIQVFSSESPQMAMEFLTTSEETNNTDAIQRIVFPPKDSLDISKTHHKRFLPYVASEKHTNNVQNARKVKRNNDRKSSKHKRNNEDKTVHMSASNISPISVHKKNSRRHRNQRFTQKDHAIPVDNVKSIQLVKVEHNSDESKTVFNNTKPNFKNREPNDVRNVRIMNVAANKEQRIKNLDESTNDGAGEDIKGLKIIKVSRNGVHKHPIDGMPVNVSNRKRSFEIQNKDRKIKKAMHFDQEAQANTNQNITVIEKVPAKISSENMPQLVKIESKANEELSRDIHLLSENNATPTEISTIATMNANNVSNKRKRTTSGFDFTTESNLSTVITNFQKYIENFPNHISTEPSVNSTLADDKHNVSNPNIVEHVEAYLASNPKTLPEESSENTIASSRQLFDISNEPTESPIFSTTSTSLYTTLKPSINEVIGIYRRAMEQIKKSQISKDASKSIPSSKIEKTTKIFSNQEPYLDVAIKDLPNEPNKNEESTVTNVEQPNSLSQNMDRTMMTYSLDSQSTTEIDGSISLKDIELSERSLYETSVENLDNQFSSMPPNQTTTVDNLASSGSTESEEKISVESTTSRSFTVEDLQKLTESSDVASLIFITEKPSGDNLTVLSNTQKDFEKNSTISQFNNTNLSTQITTDKDEIDVEQILPSEVVISNISTAVYLNRSEVENSTNINLQITPEIEKSVFQPILLTTLAKPASKRKEIDLKASSVDKIDNRSSPNISSTTKIESLVSNRILSANLQDILKTNSIQAFNENLQTVGETENSQQSDRPEISRTLNKTLPPQNQLVEKNVGNNQIKGVKHTLAIVKSQKNFVPKRIPVGVKDYTTGLNKRRHVSEISDQQTLKNNNSNASDIHQEKSVKNNSEKEIYLNEIQPSEPVTDEYSLLDSKNKTEIYNIKEIQPTKIPSVELITEKTQSRVPYAEIPKGQSQYARGERKTNVDSIEQSEEIKDELEEEELETNKGDVEHKEDSEESSENIYQTNAVRRQMNLNQLSLQPYPRSEFHFSFNGLTNLQPRTNFKNHQNQQSGIRSDEEYDSIEDPKSYQNKFNPIEQLPLSSYYINNQRPQSIPVFQQMLPLYASEPEQSNAIAEKKPADNDERPQSMSYSYSSAGNDDNSNLFQNVLSTQRNFNNYFQSAPQVHGNRPHLAPDKVSSTRYNNNQNFYPNYIPQFYYPQDNLWDKFNLEIPSDPVFHSEYPVQTDSYSQLSNSPDVIISPDITKNEYPVRPNDVNDEQQHIPTMSAVYPENNEQSGISIPNNIETINRNHLTPEDDSQPLTYNIQIPELTVATNELDGMDIPRTLKVNINLTLGALNVLSQPTNAFPLHSVASRANNLDMNVPNQLEDQAAASNEPISEKSGARLQNYGNLPLPSTDVKLRTYTQLPYPKISQNPDQNTIDVNPSPVTPTSSCKRSTALSELTTEMNKLKSNYIKTQNSGAQLTPITPLTPNAINDLPLMNYIIENTPFEQPTVWYFEFTRHRNLPSVLQPPKQLGPQNLNNSSPLLNISTKYTVYNLPTYSVDTFTKNNSQNIVIPSTFSRDPDHDVEKVLQSIQSKTTPDIQNHLKIDDGSNLNKLEADQNPANFAGQESNFHSRLPEIDYNNHNPHANFNFNYPFNKDDLQTPHRKQFNPNNPTKTPINSNNVANTVRNSNPNNLQNMQVNRPDQHPISPSDPYQPFYNAIPRHEPIYKEHKLQKVHARLPMFRRSVTIDRTHHQNIKNLHSKRRTKLHQTYFKPKFTNIPHGRDYKQQMYPNYWPY